MDPKKVNRKIMAASSTDVPPLAKYLASTGHSSMTIFLSWQITHICTDKKTRDKAVKNLAIFLSNKSEDAAIPELEMAKLWKGIFYCAYI